MAPSVYFNAINNIAVYNSAYLVMHSTRDFSFV